MYSELIRYLDGLLAVATQVQDDYRIAVTTTSVGTS
jgi:hypothetical protein